MGALTEIEIRQMTKSPDGRFYVNVFFDLLIGLQVASVVWFSSYNGVSDGSWPDWLQSLIDFFVTLRLEVVSDADFNIYYFFIVGGIICAFFSMIFFSQIPGCDEILAEMLDFPEAGWLAEHIFLGILLIPTFKDCLAIYSCSGSLWGLECSSNTHIGLIAVAVPTTLMLTVGAAIKFWAKEKNGAHVMNEPERLRNSVNWAELRFFLVRLLVVIVNFYAKDSRSVGVVLSWIVTILALVWMVWKLPYIETRYNVIKAMELSVPVWAYFITLFAINLEGGKDAAGVFLLVGLPIFVGLVMYFTAKRSENNPASEEDIVMKINSEMVWQIDLVQSEVDRLAEKYRLDKEEVCAVNKPNIIEFATKLADGANDGYASLYKAISIHGNTAEKAEAMDAVAKLLDTQTNLEILILNYCGLSGKTMTLLNERIAAHPKLRALDFYNNDIDEKSAVVAFGKYKLNPNIQRITLGENPIMLWEEVDAAAADANVKIHGR